MDDAPLGMIGLGPAFPLFWLTGMSDPSEWMLFAGIILHGVCFDFFFVTGTDLHGQQSRCKDPRAPHRVMITMATYGVGMWIGTWLSGIM